MEYPAAVIKIPQGVLCRITKTPDDTLILSQSDKYIMAAEDIQPEADKVLQPGETLYGFLTLEGQPLWYLNRVLKSRILHPQLVFQIVDWCPQGSEYRSYKDRMTEITSRYNTVRNTYTFSKLVFAGSFGEVQSQDTLDTMVLDVLSSANKELDGLMIISLGASRDADNGYTSGYMEIPLCETVVVTVEKIHLENNLCIGLHGKTESGKPVFVSMTSTALNYRAEISLSQEIIIGKTVLAKKALGEYKPYKFVEVTDV